MQFTHPELLWALFLLLIPIFIHLFQLRRFKKTPFTNVKLLQKVVSESRRSSRLKKWLLLISRLFLLAALIFAFAQPFFAKKSALQKKEVIIYLDDSFSMQAKTDRGSLLEVAVQDFIKAIPGSIPFSLFTNEKIYRDISLKDIQNDLLTLSHTQTQLELNEIYLKAQTLFSKNEATRKDLILISDFQSRMASDIDSVSGYQRHLVQMRPEGGENIALDSAHLSRVAPNNIELTVSLKGVENIENTPVSLYNRGKLIAKTAASFENDENAQVIFTLPADEEVNGKIEIADTGLAYDNQLYFNIGDKEKIKVLSINGGDDLFLRRIYSEDEFDFKTYAISELNYALIDDQNLIVLNELPSLPNGLQNALVSFVNKGGSLTIIPSDAAEINTYNLLLSNFYSTAFRQKINIEENITAISFAHPLYQNVFEKEVNNFQYPKAAQHFRIRTNAPRVLAFQSGDPFLIGAGGIYIFTSSLNHANANFKNSPLIVPTFYSMGANSLKLSPLYFEIGSSNEVDIRTSMGKDRILTIAKPNKEFIPQQQSFANKTTLRFKENPTEDGIYEVKDQSGVYKNISFNYPRAESELRYLPLENLRASSYDDNILELFERMEKDNAVTALWKWFVILALLFVFIEILIQKYFK